MKCRSSFVDVLTLFTAININKMRPVNVLFTRKLHFLVTSHCVQRFQCESGIKTEIAPVSSLLVLDINH